MHLDRTDAEQGQSLKDGKEEEGKPGRGIERLYIDGRDENLDKGEGKTVDERDERKELRRGLLVENLFAFAPFFL